MTIYLRLIPTIQPHISFLLIPNFVIRTVNSKNYPATSSHIIFSWYQIPKRVSRTRNSSVPPPHISYSPGTKFQKEYPGPEILPCHLLTYHILLVPNSKKSIQDPKFFRATSSHIIFSWYQIPKRVSRTRNSSVPPPHISYSPGTKFQKEYPGPEILPCHLLTYHILLVPNSKKSIQDPKFFRATSSHIIFSWYQIPKRVSRTRNSSVPPPHISYSPGTKFQKEYPGPEILPCHLLTYHILLVPNSKKSIQDPKFFRATSSHIIFSWYQIPKRVSRTRNSSVPPPHISYSPGTKFQKEYPGPEILPCHLLTYHILLVPNSKKSIQDPKFFRATSSHIIFSWYQIPKRVSRTRNSSVPPPHISYSPGTKFQKEYPGPEILPCHLLTYHILLVPNSKKSIQDPKFFRATSSHIIFSWYQIPKRVSRTRNSSVPPPHISYSPGTKFQKEYPGPEILPCHLLTYHILLVPNSKKSIQDPKFFRATSSHIIFSWYQIPKRVSRTRNSSVPPPHISYSPDTKFQSPNLNLKYLPVPPHVSYSPEINFQFLDP
nr:PREDICTED: uncharacterized protein LOC105663710 [Megachile rotundata]